MSRGGTATAAAVAVCMLLSATAARADPASATSAAPPVTPGPFPLEAGQHFTFDPIADGTLTAAGFGFSLLLGATGHRRDRAAVAQHLHEQSSLHRSVGGHAEDRSERCDLLGHRSVQRHRLRRARPHPVGLPRRHGRHDCRRVSCTPRPDCSRSCSPTSRRLRCAGPARSTTSTAERRPSRQGRTAPPPIPRAVLLFRACGRRRGHRCDRDVPCLRPVPGLASPLDYPRSGDVADRVRECRARACGDALSYRRDRSAMAGAAIGVLVPHLHRHSQEAPPVWIGVSPLPGGGTLALQGQF